MKDAHATISPTDQDGVLIKFYRYLLFMAKKVYLLRLNICDAPIPHRVIRDSLNIPFLLIRKYHMHVSAEMKTKKKETYKTLEFKFVSVMQYAYSDLHTIKATDDNRI